MIIVHAEVVNRVNLNYVLKNFNIYVCLFMSVLKA